MSHSSERALAFFHERRITEWKNAHSRPTRQIAKQQTSLLPSHGSVSPGDSAIPISILREWLPDGYRDGNEWVALNPTRPDRSPGSFKINIRTGAWNDFAVDGAAGHGAWSLFLYLLVHIPMPQSVIKNLPSERKQVVMPDGAQPASDSPILCWTDMKRGVEAAVANAPQEELGPATPPRRPVVPVPPWASPVEFYRNPRLGGAPTKVWPYRTAEGELVGYIARFDPPAGKTFRPLSWCDDGWHLASFAEPRPLYNLPAIIQRRDAPILVVEGEKAADAAARLFPEAIATTPPHGAKSPHKADWSHVAGRVVIISPDNDEAGQSYSRNVIKLVSAAGAAAVRVLPPETLGQWIVRDGAWVNRDQPLPVGWDLADAEAEGWTPVEAAGRLEHAQLISGGEPSRSTFFSVAELHGQSVPSRHWLVPDLIPTHTVTMLSGDGGTGKSLLAAQLAVAVALGRPWIGHEVATGRALYLSAEDDKDELHRRFFAIAESERVSLADFEQLTVRSLAGEDALLADLDRSRDALTSTSLMDELDQRIHDEKPALVVLDTLADLHPANENDRAKARQFIGMMRGLAIRYQTSVLLLAHPSLSGIASGTGTSGSTAWNNSVRSRLYLERVIEDGTEADPDARVLTTKKSNYARVGSDTRVRWQPPGVFVSLAAGIDREEHAERVFLKLLREFASSNRRVNGNSGPMHAPAVFIKTLRTEGCSKRELRSAMESLYARGKICNQITGPASRSTTFIAETTPL